MSEKSQFALAFEDFQRDITGILHELAGSTDFFRNVSGFPLPSPPEPINLPNKKQKKQKNEKTDQVDEEKEKKNQNDRNYTPEEIDKVIIDCSARTTKEFTSKDFIKNIKRKVKNITTQDLLKRINELMQQGKIVQNSKSK